MKQVTEIKAKRPRCTETVNNVAYELTRPRNKYLKAFKPQVTEIKC